jgi:hypothetical protein
MALFKVEVVMAAMAVSPLILVFRRGLLTVMRGLLVVMPYL